jgi:hypothetical protein
MPRLTPHHLGLTAMSAVALMLVSCGPAETDPAAGGVNAGDAKALDEAAKRLDERQATPGKGRPQSD